MTGRPALAESRNLILAAPQRAQRTRRSADDSLGCRFGYGRVPRLFVVESTAVRVRVRFGSGHEPDVNVLLGPATDREAGYDDRDFDILGLGVLSERQTYNQTFTPRTVASPEDVRRVLEDAARVLERDCAAILRGDRSI